MGSTLEKSAAAEEPGPAANYDKSIVTLERAVREDLIAHRLHGMSVALVDDQQVVYAAAFGNVRRDDIFRAGSISKLFNAVAVMQMVERGNLDLDAPIERCCGTRFKIVVPFENAPAITLRQLLCHRSGMVREAPVGGYFDFHEPSLAETVASIHSCVLVNPPETKTRYSNIGPSIAGQVVAAVAGVEYARYQQEHVLEPLGMTSSSFLLSGIERQRLAKSFMQVADGRGGLVEQRRRRCSISARFPPATSSPRLKTSPASSRCSPLAAWSMAGRSCRGRR